jgi:hypothetical protein
MMPMEGRFAASVFLVALAACGREVRDAFSAPQTADAATDGGVSTGEGGAQVAEPCDAGGFVVVRFEDAGEHVMRHGSRAQECIEDAPCITAHCGQFALTACAAPDGGLPCIRLTEGASVYTDVDGGKTEIVDASFEGGTFRAAGVSGEYETCAFYPGAYGCE